MRTPNPSARPIKPWEQAVVVLLALAIGFTAGTTVADWRRVEPREPATGWLAEFVTPAPTPTVVRTLPPTPADPGPVSMLWGV